MLKESLEALNLHNDSVICDCTLGGAGHSSKIAEAIASDGYLIGVDQDDIALSAARARLSALNMTHEPILLKGNFGDLDELLARACVPYVNGFLFDLGVSSPQLDIPERGFSYMEDAPLDMRMDPSKNTLTAAEIINTYTEADLARILTQYGEEKWAVRIAKFIVDARAKAPIETTLQLVDVIKAAIPAKVRQNGHHPAKKSFQALRIEVNGELDVLRRGLDAAIRWLSPKGRIVVISYHSLEDRIVKEAFADAAKTCTCPPELPVCMCNTVPVLEIVTRKPLLPSEEEIEMNPRARSAKLRIAQKI
jgi:16S rRNA (cytosine1402-N4)-methyltransferase